MRMPLLVPSALLMTLSLSAAVRAQTPPPNADSSAFTTAEIQRLLPPPPVVLQPPPSLERSICAWIRTTYSETDRAATVVVQPAERVEPLDPRSPLHRAVLNRWWVQRADWPADGPVGSRPPSFEWLRAEVRRAWSLAEGAPLAVRWHALYAGARFCAQIERGVRALPFAGSLVSALCVPGSFGPNGCGRPAPLSVFRRTDPQAPPATRRGLRLVREVPPVPPLAVEDASGADPFGLGPLGSTGTGWGGGSTGEGTIGMGGIGTLPQPSASESGQGYGSGAGRGLRSRPMPSAASPGAACCELVPPPAVGQPACVPCPSR